MRRFLTTTALTLLLVSAFSIGTTQPASATIHELVASFCSGRDVQDPPGQSAFGTQSFVRALQATGVIQSIQFGVVPAGQPGPEVGTTPVTVNFDYSRPATKFSAVGGFIRIVDTAAGLTVYLTAGVPDHPAFDHCPKLAFLD